MILIKHGEDSKTASNLGVFVNEDDPAVRALVQKYCSEMEQTFNRCWVDKNGVKHIDYGSHREFLFVIPIDS